MRHRRSSQVVSRLRELTLPSDERRAALAERQAELRMRRERDNSHTYERRAARIDAEARQYGSIFGKHEWRPD
jgi:hypothetical protein